MNNEQRRILDYLNHNAQGHRNRKSSDEIRDELDIESGGRTNENIRNLIRDMIINDNCCIGSDTRGYWMILNEEELRKVVSSLINRAEEINERAQALERNWANRDHN